MRNMGTGTSKYLSGGRLATAFSNAFTPREVLGLKLWLVAALGVVSLTWSDLSGAGNNATAASGGEMPAQTASIVNGHAVMRFDGTKRMTITGAALGITGAFTCVVATQCTGNGTGGSGRDAGIFGNGVSHHFQMTHDQGSTRDDYIHTGGNAVSYAFGKNTWAVQTLRWSGGTGANGMQDWKNGALQAQQASTQTPSDTANYKIGIEPDGVTFYQGDIEQIVLFASSVSDSNRARVEIAMRLRDAI